MTYSAISTYPAGLMKDAAGTTTAAYYLKLYRAGTTTAISMATDTTGNTLLSKCKLNQLGLPISDDTNEDSVFVPHINESFKLAVYPTAEDADNNTTANALYIIDELTTPAAVVGTAIGYPTVNDDTVSGATALTVDATYENTYRRVLGSSASDVLTYTIDTDANQGWTAGTEITFHLQGEGVIILSPAAGVTINKPDYTPDDSNVSIKFRGQTIVLKNVGTDAWDATVSTPPFADIKDRTSASNTPTVAWAGRVNTMNSASAQTITIENVATRDWQIGQRIDFIRKGAGTVTFAAGSGVTINSSAGNLSLKNRYSAASVFYEGSDVWYLVGDLDT